MKKVYQSHDKECWPACIASIFELPLADVAHLQGEFWLENTTHFLDQRDLVYLELPVASLGFLPFTGQLACIVLLESGDYARHSVVGFLEIKEGIIELVGGSEGLHDPDVENRMVNLLTKGEARLVRLGFFVKKFSTE